MTTSFFFLLKMSCRICGLSLFGFKKKIERLKKDLMENSGVGPVLFTLKIEGLYFLHSNAELDNLWSLQDSVVYDGVFGIRRMEKVDSRDPSDLKIILRNYLITMMEKYFE